MTRVTIHSHRHLQLFLGYQWPVDAQMTGFAGG
jgi:hypothetical protein